VASSPTPVRARTQMKSEGQSIELPMLSIVPPIDSIQQNLQVEEELCNNVLDEGVPLLITEGEEVASRMSE